MFFNKKKNPTIPTLLHFIWLGSVLRNAGKKNVKAWRESNPDYDITVWYDSAVFPSEKDANHYDEHQKKFQSFKAWADRNRININDINAMYASMENRLYYDHAIIGNQANFAEASDIARVEIIKKWGGIYLDVEDIFPARPLGMLMARHGFLCHVLLDEGKFNNDIIAAVPNHAIVNDIIKQMSVNYKKHYQDSRKIYAHRSSILGGFKLGLDSRKDSTIALSGPSLIQQAVNTVTQFPTGERLEKAYAEMGLDAVGFLSSQYYSDFTFPESCYKTPLKQAASWGLAKTLTDKEAFQQHIYYCLLLKCAKQIKQQIKDKYDDVPSSEANALTKWVPNFSIPLAEQLEKKLTVMLGMTRLQKDKIIQTWLGCLHEDENKLRVFLTLFLSELSENEKRLALIDFYKPNSQLDDVLALLRPSFFTRYVCC